MTMKDKDNPLQDPPGGGRRQGDRRTGEESGYTGPERRKHERRSGSDRRINPRDDGSET